MLIFETIFMALVMILVGFLALRIAGRKSLSQMTIAQVVIMIAVGSILVEPIKNDDIFVTIISIFMFILVLIFLEWIAYKSRVFEKLIIGQKKMVIKNGKILFDNLRKMRMTENQLLMTLRMKGIFEINDIEYATIETNGELGYLKYNDRKPLKKGDYLQFENKNTLAYFQSKYDKLDNRMEKIELKINEINNNLREHK